MLGTDRDALLCDLAETYGIYSFEALPVPVLATLSSGLRADSRIKTKLAGMACSHKDAMLAAICDRLAWLCWSMTADARTGTNRPKSLLAKLLGVDETQSSGGDVEAFETGSDFQAAWYAITGQEVSPDV